MKPLIVANWKMNPLKRKDAEVLFRRVYKGVMNVNNADVVICPSFVHLPILGALARATSVRIGAQDFFWENAGPFTGEVSAGMLQNCGATFVIIGHSERRLYLGETDTMVNKKVRMAVGSGLMPVICVGARMRGREAPKIIARQLRAALAGVVPARAQNIAIAYEPIWAIGTGDPETPEGAVNVRAHIKKILVSLFGVQKGGVIRVLYGGSVTAENAGSFTGSHGAGLDGLLVGGASLKSKEFAAIVRAILR